METSYGLRERTAASRKCGGWCLVPKDIRGAIIVAQGLQGLKTSVSLGTGQWEAVESFLSHVQFLMATKLCKTLLFPEVGNSTGNKPWGSLSGPGKGRDVQVGRKVPT